MIGASPRSRAAVMDRWLYLRLDTASASRAATNVRQGTGLP